MHLAPCTLPPFQKARIRSGRHAYIRGSKSSLHAAAQVREVETKAVDVSPQQKREKDEGIHYVEFMQQSLMDTQNIFTSQIMAHFQSMASYLSRDDVDPGKASPEPREEKEKGEPKLPADITPYLVPVGVWELKHIRKLSSLCALTYKMHKVTKQSLHNRHRLDLVAASTSSADVQPYIHDHSIEEYAAEGDGMGVSILDVMDTYNIPPDDFSPFSTFSTFSPFSTRTSSPMHKSSGSGSGSNIVPIPSFLAPPQHLPSGREAASSALSPGDMVAAKLAEASAAASLAVASWGLLNGAGSGSKPSQIKTPVPTYTSSLTPGQRTPSGSQPPSGSYQPPSGSFWPPSGSFQPPSGSSATSLATSLPPPTSEIPPCPSEWFICDDKVGDVRYFAIQGSDTLDHWKLNLTFDPMPFLDPSWGVVAHQGVYLAAQDLYDKFLPYVYQHIESSPFAKVSFTGHSVGGSIAKVLMLMFKHNGVLKASQLATTYTFGAPAVFFDTSDFKGSAAAATSELTHHHQHLDKSFNATSSSERLHRIQNLDPATAADGNGNESSVHRHPSTSTNHATTQALHPKPPSSPSPTSSPSSSSSPSPSPTTITSRTSTTSNSTCDCTCGTERLLSRLGLQSHDVRNVFMARDIVPRAFTCDYSAVSDILKGWNPLLRSHSGLADMPGQRKHMYCFVGKSIVLQPDASWHWFASAEPDHPLLPPGPQMYNLCEPPSRSIATPPPSTTTAAPAAATAHHNVTLGAAAPPPPSTTTIGTTAGTAAFAATTGASTAATAPTASTNAASTIGIVPPAPSPAPLLRPVSGLQEALWELMDDPHPLRVLSDAAGYTPYGSISRYHNPDNYTAAIGRITYLARRVGQGGGTATTPSTSTGPAVVDEDEEEEEFAWDASLWDLIDRYRPQTPPFGPVPATLKK